MNEIIEKDKLRIEEMIYEIRGKQVMLDSDLARLYHVETKRINEAVKNNPMKFQERFSWKLTDKDLKFFWSKISTKKILKHVVENLKTQEYLQSKASQCSQPS